MSRFLRLTVLLMLCSTSFAFGAVHIVDSWNHTIQEVVDMAAEGDTLLLIGEFTGTGNVNVDLGDKNLHIAGLGDEPLTVIEGNWSEAAWAASFQGIPFVNP